MTSKVTLIVTTPQGDSGQLRYFNESYSFSYAPNTSDRAAVSLTMTQSTAPHEDSVPMPIFQMNLPEGYLLEMIKARLSLATDPAPMMLLAATGMGAGIGRVSLSSHGFNPSPPTRGGQLNTLLADQGEEDMFERLAEAYLLRSGVSGVQPKLLIPEESPKILGETPLATNPELLVKTSGGGISKALRSMNLSACPLPRKQAYLFRSSSSPTTAKVSLSGDLTETSMGHA